MDNLTDQIEASLRSARRRDIEKHTTSLGAGLRNTQEVAEILGVSLAVARQELQRLADQGVVECLEPVVGQALRWRIRAVKSCGTCKWFDASLGGAVSTMEEDEDGEILGHCTWPADRLPWSLRYGNRERIGVYATEGADCSAYESQEG